MHSIIPFSLSREASTRAVNKISRKYSQYSEKALPTAPYSFLSACHGEIIYGDTSWIEDDCHDTFSEFIFLFPTAAALCHDFSLVDSVET